MARLLILRAQPDADLTAAHIRSLGHEAIIAPLRQAQAVVAAEPAKPDALVVTSANALRLGKPISDEWFDLPIFCVGERSAALAAQIGFSRIRAAEHVEALISMILQSAEARSRLLYLAGEPRRPLLEAGFPAQLDIWLRYRMIDAAQIPDVAIEALREGACDGVLHFSEQSARLWLKLARQAGHLARALLPAQACLSEPVAAVIRAGADEAGQVCRIVVAKEMHGDATIGAAIAGIERARMQID